jgi:hypothetical protein
MTSTSGVMLISFITSSVSSWVPKAMAGPLHGHDFSGPSAVHACAGHKVGMQVMGEAVQLGHDELVAAYQRVVAQHRGNGDRQPQRGHDQRLANRPGHLVDGGLPGHADAHQRVVDAPDCAEQADKGGGGADRGEDGQTRLQRATVSSMELRRAAGHPVADVQCVVQLLACVLRWWALASRPSGQLVKRVALVITQLDPGLGEIVAVPEQLGRAWPACLNLDDVERLDDDHHPGGQRHGEQQQHHAAGDPVALVQTLMRPSCDSMRLLQKLHVYFRTNVMGTLNHMASGTPPRLPGT